MSKHWLIEITLEGLNLERCIRQCTKKGISLRDVSRKERALHAAIAERDLPLLTQTAALGGWQLTVGRRMGLGKWLERMDQRWMLICAGCLWMAVIMLTGGMMWRTEIIDAGVYAADLRETIRTLGINPPKFKS